MATPLINGTAYSWAQLKINILGANPAGITAISYKDKEEMQNNYGIGNQPVSRSTGKIEPEASISMHMTELEALQEASPSGRIQDIPEFDIVVSYIPKGGRIVTHTLHNCRFMENGRDLKQNDMEIVTDVPMILSHISWK